MRVILEAFPFNVAWQKMAGELSRRGKCLPMPIIFSSASVGSSCRADFQSAGTGRLKTCPTRRKTMLGRRRFMQQAAFGAAVLGLPVAVAKRALAAEPEALPSRELLATDPE